VVAIARALGFAVGLVLNLAVPARRRYRARVRDIVAMYGRR